MNNQKLNCYRCNKPLTSNRIKETKHIKKKMCVACSIVAQQTVLEGAYKGVGT